jgi:subtilisin
MDRRRTALLIAVASLVLSAAAPVSASPEHHLDVIVVLDTDHPGVRGAGADVAGDHGVAPSHVYAHALDGFAGPVPAGRLRALERDPRVAHVELDAEVAAVGQVVPTGVQRVQADANPTIPTDGDGGAVDADVAVLDTGIDAAHPDLDVVSSTTCLGRVRTGPPSGRGHFCEAGGTDYFGHGTHVAGTIAARNNGQGVVGVAPGARLWSVKVLGDDGQGQVSAVVAGVDHVTANADRIDIANLSLAGPVDADTVALERAISASVAAGVTYVLAAGNEGVDVDEVTPAGHPDALTVAALVDYDGQPGGQADSYCGDADEADPWADDTFWPVSNHGAGVDLIAPGVCILSTIPGGGHARADGTSMASPHVAGAAALLASQGEDDPSIRATLTEQGSDDWDTGTAPGSYALPLLDVGDADVFAPVLVEGEEPVQAGPVALAGTAERLPGSVWQAHVAVTASSEAAAGDEVVLEYRATHAAGTTTCDLDEQLTCAVALELPNRDRSVTFTAVTLDGAPIEDGPSVTIARTG